MGKILCFIYDNMADFELTMATTTLSWIEKEIISISYDMNPKRGSGLMYQPHMTVKEALELEDVEGLIIPGGWNDELKPKLKTLIQKLNKENKLLAAICAGPQFLAKSDVLNDKKYTTTLTKEYFQKENKEDFFPRSNFLSQKVVRDQNIITAVGNSFVDFAMEVIDYFNAFKDDEMKKGYANTYKGL